MFVFGVILFLKNRKIPQIHTHTIGYASIAYACFKCFWFVLSKTFLLSLVVHFKRMKQFFYIYNFSECVCVWEQTHFDSWQVVSCGGVISWYKNLT